MNNDDSERSGAVKLKLSVKKIRKLKTNVVGGQSRIIYPPSIGGSWTF